MHRSQKSILYQTSILAEYLAVNTETLPAKLGCDNGSRNLGHGTSFTYGESKEHAFTLAIHIAFATHILSMHLQVFCFSIFFSSSSFIPFFALRAALLSYFPSICVHASFVRIGSGKENKRTYWMAIDLEWMAFSLWFSFFFSWFSSSFFFILYFLRHFRFHFCLCSFIE